MTETMLITLIMTACGTPAQNNDPYEKILECQEYYTNCAVIEAGKILSLEDFEKKCHKWKK